MADLPETENLTFELSQGWLTIWFNRPESRNALSDGLVADLTKTLQQVREDRSVRGITLRGRGGVFCAGGDLKSFRSSLMNADRDTVVASSKKAAALFALINSMPQVTIMIVEGAAMAGGLGIVCTGDVVIAEAEAQFALTETMIGISPAQISPYLVQKFGFATARRLMLTAARFDGIEGQRLGLIDFLAPNAGEIDALEAGIKEQVLKCAPGAVAATKALVLALPELSEEARTAAAADSFASCLLGDEGREGVASFLEKRRPSWSVKLEEAS